MSLLRAAPPPGRLRRGIAVGRHFAAVRAASHRTGATARRPSARTPGVSRPGSGCLYGDPVDPLLLITNVDAGGGRQEGLDLALGVLREDADVEVAVTGNPGELD